MRRRGSASARLGAVLGTLALALAACEDGDGGGAPGDAAGGDAAPGASPVADGSGPEGDAAGCLPPDPRAPAIGASLSLGPEHAGLAQCLGQTGQASVEVERWAAKVSALGVGDGGRPGQGIDVDGDPQTCAPAGSCEAGIDNGLGGLSSLANQGIGEALAQGTLLLALDAPGLAIEAEGAADAFEIRMYSVYLDPLDEACDWQTQTCEYRVRTDSFDEQCAPLMALPGTLGPHGSIRAGSAESTLLLTIPLFGLLVEVTALSVRLEGSVEFDCDGRPVALRGVLGGALRPAELAGALQAIPEEEFEAAGVNKQLVVGALDLLASDIDTTGDGSTDAISVGLVFETIPGVLVGATEPNP